MVMGSMIGRMEVMRDIGKRVNRMELENYSLRENSLSVCGIEVDEFRKNDYKYNAYYCKQNHIQSTLHKKVN
jgi:hypothetical protein